MAKHVSRKTALTAIADDALSGPSVQLDPEHYAIAKRVGLVTALREQTARLGRVMDADDFSEFVDAYAVTLGEKRATYAVTAATRLLAASPDRYSTRQGRAALNDAARKVAKTRKPETTETEETPVPKKTRARKAALDAVTDKRLTRVETDLTDVRGEVAEIREDVTAIKATQEQILAILRGRQTATGETVQAEAKPARKAKTEPKTEPAKAEVIALVDAKAKAKKAPTGAARKAWHSNAYRLILAAGRGKDAGALWSAVTEGRDAGLTPAKAVKKALANA